MKHTYLFLADGFEEVEGLTVVDLLRRAQIACTMVSITGNLTITGSHGISLQADVRWEDADFSDADMLILPGGMPGTNHLSEHAGLRNLLLDSAPKGIYLAAICAAPSVLGANGLLAGRKATCYPGFESSLTDAIPSTSPVVCDGNIITSRGMGTAIDFSLKLVELLQDKAAADALAAAIQYQ